MSDDQTQNDSQGSSKKKGAYVDPVTCIGCTLCTQICPNVYEMQDDGKSKATNPTNDTEEKIQESIEACPVDAISWKDVEEAAE
jgi:ferredoxin